MQRISSKCCQRIREKMHCIEKRVKKEEKLGIVGVEGIETKGLEFALERKAKGTSDNDSFNY